MLQVGGITEIQGVTYRVMALIEGLGPYGYALEALNNDKPTEGKQ